MIEFDKEVLSFVKACNNHNVQMILVGGAAVNFHGYQRHSADVDFWISTKHENLKNLVTALRQLQYDIKSFPQSVFDRLQNISIKFSPLNPIEVELITRFSIGRSFREAYEVSELSVISDHGSEVKIQILSLEDLLESKSKTERVKDILDVAELKKLHNLY